MWTATYKNIDKSGLQAELRVTVIFSNDQDNTTYEPDYNVLAEELSTTFAGVVQAQLDVLNAKDNVKQTDIDVLINQPIKPIVSPPIIKPLV